MIKTLKKVNFKYKYLFFVGNNIISFFYKNMKLYLNYTTCCNLLFITNSESIIYNYNLKKQNIFNLFILSSTFGRCFNIVLSFVKFNIIGLGYKYFFYRGYIYLLIGLSHFMLFELPKDVFLCCKKKKMFLISSNKQKLVFFANLIKFARKPNIYKGKGITEFSQFRNNILLKKGKKQQVS